MVYQTLEKNGPYHIMVTKFDTGSQNSLASIGQMMKAARVSNGIPINQYSKDLKISCQYLHAIEMMDLQALPAIGYTLGYVRSYAQALGMDGPDAMQAFREATEAPRKMALRERVLYVSRNRLRLPRGSISAALTLGCAAALVIWFSDQSETIPIPLTVFASTPPTSGVKQVLSNDVVTIKAVRASWVKIIDPAAVEQAPARIFTPGQTWQSRRGSEALISARDGGALEVYVGEKLIGTLGRQGEVIEGVNLNERLNAVGSFAGKAMVDMPR